MPSKLLSKCKLWLSRKPSNRLQRLNLIISIIGVALSVLLSLVALRLTYKFGANDDQLKQLISLAQKQDKEISRLDSIYGQDKQQTENSSTLIRQMKFSNEKLIKQSALLEDQVQLLAQQQKTAIKVQILTDRASYMQLKNAVLKLLDDNNPKVLQAINNPNPDKSERTDCITHIQEILGKELSNTYLLEHPKIDAHWNDLYVGCNVLLSFENSSTGIHQYVRDGVTHSDVLTNNELEKEQIQMFEDIIKKGTKLIIEVTKDGSWKKGESLIF